MGLCFLGRHRVSCAELVSNPARLFFKRTDTELGAMVSIVEVLADPLLEAATALALRNVNEIMQEQLTIAPGIGSNDNGMTKTDAARVVRDYAGPPRGLGQLLIIGQGNPIDDQHSDT